MDNLRPDDVAARVVAWHNRHPLARRITAAQVQSVGSVALPFFAPPGAVLPAELAALASTGEAGGPASTVDAGDAGRVEDVAAPAQAAHASLRERVLARAGEAPSAAPAAAAALARPAGRLARWRAALAQALARLRRTRDRARVLRPAFSEDFIAPLSRRQVSRWALRHGWQPTDAVLRGPLRRVETDPALLGGASTTLTLVLTTAAIEQGSRRARLLLADDAAGGVAGALGPRLWSRPRLAGLASSVALAGAALAWPWLPAPWRPTELPSLAAVFQRLRPSAAPQAPAPATAPADLHAAGASAQAVEPPVHAAASAAVHEAHAAVSAHPDPAQPEVAAVAPAAPAAVPVPPASPHSHARALPPDDAPAETHAAPAAAVAVASAAVPQVAPEAVPGFAPTVAAVTPPAAEARRGRVVLALAPPLDDETKAAARRAVAELRAARGLPAVPAPPAAAAVVAAVPAEAAAPHPGPAIAAAPAPAPAVAAVAHTLPPPGTPVFALATRPLRTRAESEQFLLALRTLLAAQSPVPGRPPLRVELMEAGEDWRVVCWPFTRRDDAERARALLAGRGMKVQTVDF